MKKFKDQNRTATRALQAYLVLIGLAKNRPTITYGDLSKCYMKYGVGRNLAKPLGCIMGWCAENDLPPLTVLVVDKKTGIPGQGLTTIGEFAAEVNTVFGYDWFSLMPPGEPELEEAGALAITGFYDK